MVARQLLVADLLRQPRPSPPAQQPEATEVSVHEVRAEAGAAVDRFVT